jgi:hypothetical protein
VPQNDAAVPQLDLVGDRQVPTVVAPVPERQAPVVVNVPEGDESTVAPTQAPVPIVPEAGPPHMRGREGGRNKKYFGDEWVNYQTGSTSAGSTQKIHASALDRQFIE